MKKGIEPPYKHLTPFKRCVLQNFPFIEADFDALTNYGLLCKVVEYLNKVINSQNTLVNSQNELTEDVIKLAEDFTALKNYVDNFFDTLDVQEEVNNKLDQMLANGDLGQAIQIASSAANYQKCVLGERIINGTATRVACVGDSLTWCQKPGDTSTQLTTWSSMIEDFINDWYNNESLLTMDNFGVKGEQSAASLTKFDTYIANSPQTIIWAYGTNDMTQGVSVDSFLGNLKEFYQMCINENIELIVIIAPPSYQTLARRDKMLNLAKAERVFCQKYGIKYVDMFEYVDNLYLTQSATHNVLQSDNTHFSDYTCYRDAILSTIFGVTVNQTESKLTYIDIGKARNYFHTNGNEIIVSGGVNMFNSGVRLREETASENSFSINIQLKKKSKIYFLTYGNNTAGKIDYSINGGTAVTIDTQLSSSTASTTSKDLCEYIQIGGVHNAGLVNILFNNPDYTDASGNGRIYVFGFIVEEIDNIMIDSTKIYQLRSEMLIWSGNETALTDADLTRNVNKFNKLLVEFGTTAGGISYAEIYPHDPFVNFDKDGNNTEIPYYIAVATPSGLVNACVTIDHVNNTASFTGDGTIAIRRIVGFLDNNTKMLKSQTLSDITNTSGM